MLYIIITSILSVIGFIVILITKDPNSFWIEITGFCFIGTAAISAPFLTVLLYDKHNIEQKKYSSVFPTSILVKLFPTLSFFIVGGICLFIYSFFVSYVCPPRLTSTEEYLLLLDTKVYVFVEDLEDRKIYYHTKNTGIDEYDTYGTKEYEYIEITLREAAENLYLPCPDCEPVEY